MESMMRRRRFKITAKLLVFYAALCMLMGSLSYVRAAEGDPDTIDDVYRNVNGVNYYNTETDCFSSDANQYFKDLLEKGHHDLAWNGYNRSTSDLWLEIAGGLYMGKAGWDDKSYGAAIDLAASQGSNSYTPDLGISPGVSTRRYSITEMMSDDMKSLKDAEEYVYYKAGINGTNASNGYFKDKNNEQTVAVGIIKASKSDSFRVAAVYFTNFKIVALFPEDEGKNYVTTVLKDNTVSSEAVASTVRNNTGVQATGSQTISNNYTASMTSSVSGCETYTYQEGINISNEFSSGLFNKFKVDVSFTASQSFQKGWEESKGVSESNGGDQSVSVSLPPYTNVMMIQKTTNADYVTKYNCPVGITFDTTIVIYDNTGVCTGPNSGTANGNKMVFSFSGTARQSLERRYKEWKGQTERLDSEGIKWSDVTAYDKLAQHPTHIGDAIDKAGTYVPVAPTGAEFRQKLKLVSAEIDGIMPIYPLRAIVVDSLNIPRYEDTGSYNSYNYLSMKMPVGDTTYTRYFSLSGYNEYDVPFYGFSKAFGSWKVVDENGEEWTGEDAPVKLGNDAASGYPAIHAIKPGVCYLKYYIDENTYNTSLHPDQYTKNADLKTTAVIQITVTHEHKLKRIPPKEAACTEKGNTKYWICEDDDCGKIFSDSAGKDEITAKETEIKALGHDWGEWEVTTAATEKSEGIETRKCRRDDCDAEETRSIPPTSHVHKLTRIPPKEATCTEPGNVVYWICNDGDVGCGNIFSDADGENMISEEETVIKAEGHKWNKGVVTKYPSTGKEGKIEYICETCGESKTITLNKLRAVNVYAKMSAGGKNSEVITWKKANADGYMVYFAPCDTNDSFGTCTLVKIIKNNNTFKYTKTGLKKGKPYKAYVAAYKKVKGKRIVIGKSLIMHSVTGNASKKYTNPKSVSMKLNKITVAKGKKYVLKGQSIITYKKKRKLLGKGHDKKYRYLSSNKNIAKVSGKGVITGINKGSCTVHIVALNGVRKTIKVTVR